MSDGSERPTRRETLGDATPLRHVTAHQYQEARVRALQMVQEAVWGMVGSNDIELVLNSIQPSLQAMGMPVTHFAITAVDMVDPPTVSVYRAQAGEQVQQVAELIVTDADPFATAVVDSWRRGQIHQVRDMSRGGSTQRHAMYDTYLAPLSALIEAPFSHGVLLLPAERVGAFTPRQVGFVTELCQVLSEGFRRLDDLRELTLSEKRYRTLVETPNLVVMLLDDQQNFIYVSPQIESWLGYRPDEFYADATFVENILHPDDRENLRAHLAPSPNPTTLDLEFRWRTRAGEYRWGSASIFPIYESAADERLQRVSMVQIVIQDVTERKRGEERLKRSLAEKEILLREIHHRVKNNLQIISSLLHLQARDVEDQRVLEVFQDSQHRIKTMALIHEELYSSDDLAHIDFTAYVRSLVAHLFDSYAVSTDRIQPEIQVENLSLDLEQAIPLGLIINELVSNALKHGFPEQRPGHVRVSLSAAPGHGLRLQVSDDGIGLPQEMDLHASSTLGLKLVHALARQLHGELEVNTDGSGTRITVRCT